MLPCPFADTKNPRAPPATSRRRSEISAMDGDVRWRREMPSKPGSPRERAEEDERLRVAPDDRLSLRGERHDRRRKDHRDAADAVLHERRRARSVRDARVAVVRR